MFTSRLSFQAGKNEVKTVEILRRFLTCALLMSQEPNVVPYRLGDTVSRMIRVEAETGTSRCSLLRYAVLLYAKRRITRRRLPPKHRPPHVLQAAGDEYGAKPSSQEYTPSKCIVTESIRLSKTCTALERSLLSRYSGFCIHILPRV